jgi:hypothetical protein
MIDLASETIISLSEVPKHLPAKRGRRFHLATIYRWAQCGLRGVRLETLRLGGSRVTSVEALQRFAERLTNPAAGDADGRTDARRERAAEAVEAQLDRLGI